MAPQLLLWSYNSSLMCPEYPRASKRSGPARELVRPKPSGSMFTVVILPVVPSIRTPTGGFYQSGIDVKGVEVDAKGVEVDAKGVDVDAKGVEVDATGVKVDATGVEVDAARRLPDERAWRRACCGGLGGMLTATRKRACRYQARDQREPCLRPAVGK
eukprot:1193475-Prorocentrum_minimum.AAC.5